MNKACSVRFLLGSITQFSTDNSKYTTAYPKPVVNE